jgi:hypothetical protein
MNRYIVVAGPCRFARWSSGLAPLIGFFDRGAAYLSNVESNTEAPPIGPLDLAVAEVLDSTLKSK